MFLRYKDRKYIFKTIFKNNAHKVTEECNNIYSKHNYIEFKNAFDKIISNDVEDKDMKKLVYQKVYFIYNYQKSPFFNIG